MRNLPEILADLEAAHAAMARALAELVLACPSAAQSLGPIPAGIVRLPVLDLMRDEAPTSQAEKINIARPSIAKAKPEVAPRAPVAPPSKVIGGAGSRTVFYPYRGEQMTARQLATLAGCSYDTMFFRLRRHTPEDAVAMGSASRAHNAVKARDASARIKAAEERAPPPPPAPRPSVFEYRKPPAPPPQQTSARVAAGFGKDSIAPGSKLEAAKHPPALSQKAEVIIPPDVKRTVAPTPPGRFSVAEAPSTFGRIGQYERTGSALERATLERVER